MDKILNKKELAEWFDNNLTNSFNYKKYVLDVTSFSLLITKKLHAQNLKVLSSDLITFCEEYIESYEDSLTNVQILEIKTDIITTKLYELSKSVELLTYSVGKLENKINSYQLIE